MNAPPAVERLCYPVLLWRKGYSYVAKDPVELCVHPRSLFAQSQERAEAGEFKLADSSGALFAVTGFAQVRPFGGWRTLPHVVLRSVFAAPTLRDLSPEEFAEFRHVIALALKPRFGKQFAARLEQAQSASEVLHLVSERDALTG